MSRTPATLFVILGLLGIATPALGQHEEARESHSDSAPAAPAAPDAAGRQPDLAEVAQQVVRLTNEFRAEQKREPVKATEELQAAAQYFADYMARTGRYGHTADGSRPSQRAEKHGYEYCLVSENIAYQYSSAGFAAEELAKAFTDGWINSPGHRKNMLEPAVVDTGVAVARSASGTYYAVQMFGRPTSMRVEFSIANELGRAVRYTVGGQTFTLPPRVTRTHEQCRPPELRFDPTGDSTAPNGQGKTDGQEELVFRPKGGSRYVVEPGKDGGVAVREQ